MVDEKKISPDDEYQFPQEEYVTANPNELPKNDEFGSEGVAAESSSPKNIFTNYQSSLFKNRRFIIIAIVLCVLFLIPFMMDRFKTSTPAVSTPAPTSAELPPPTVTPQPTVAATPQPMPEISPVMPSSDNSKLDNKIQGLEQQVESMQNSLSQSQATNEALQKSVTQLAQQMQMLSAALQKSQASEQKSPKIKKVVFHLRAIVPDRAWVVTSSGETVSVSVGDSLDQYGTIQSIDPVYGVIETSSGRKITYGSNDF